MKAKVSWLCSLLAGMSCVAIAGDSKLQQLPAPRVITISPVAVMSLKERIAKEKFALPALEQLRADAGRALRVLPASVTEKAMLPPSGDKHDYMSLSPYWWPDPSKPDGLPYVRRDGEVNPESKKVQDHAACVRTIKATHTLALAYYLFGDERYAEHASKLLRAWFLDPATRMNPNLNYAQAVRGRDSGRGSGLIETRHFSKVVDAIGLLAGSKSWTAADKAGMEQWFAAFSKWMQQSPNGRHEARAQNNHGTYYDVQLASVAFVGGDSALTKRILAEVPEKRIASQVEPDGRQPRELERTRALSYSTMNLMGLFELASIAENFGVDVWAFETKDGRSIRKALDYLALFATGEQKWPHKQIIEFNGTELAELFAIASTVYDNAMYEQIARKLDPEVGRSMDWLLVNESRGRKTQK